MKSFLKNYDKDSDIGYVLEVEVGYPKRLQNLHNDLSFSQERMEIKKCNRLVCHLYDRNNYVST